MKAIIAILILCFACASTTYSGNSTTHESDFDLMSQKMIDEYTSQYQELFRLLLKIGFKNGLETANSNIGERYDNDETAEEYAAEMSRKIIEMMITKD